MEMLYAVVFTLTLLADIANGDSSSFTTARQLAWLGARQRCQQSASCDLAVQISGQQNAWESLSLDPGTLYWVGARLTVKLLWKESKQPLIEELGCYERPSTLKSDVRAIKYNGPERCLTECDGNHVAIQDTTCYCVTAEMTSSLTQRRLLECHKYCSREPYRCGGDNSRISLYKVADRTLYEKRGKSTTFFWRRSYTNDNEHILITNKPSNVTRHFCVSKSEEYTISDSPCPAGSQPISFDNVNIMQFLDQSSSATSDWGSLSFPLPLGYSRDVSWLNGDKTSVSEGRGRCVAVKVTGQVVTLVRMICKDRRPSLCSCYTPSNTTEATTLQTMTTTPQPTTTTTTASPETTTTTSEPMTTTTTASPETTTTTTPEASTSSTTDAPTTTTTTTTAATSTSERQTTPSPPLVTSEKTEVLSDVTSSASVTSDPEEEVTTTMVVNSTIEFGNLSWPMIRAPTSDVQPEDTDTGNKLLFPFEDMEEDGPPSGRAAPPGSPGPSTSGDPASAIASIELIVGAAVGSIAVLLIVIIVIVVVKRRKKESSASLLTKKKTNPPPPRNTSYPI